MKDQATTLFSRHNKQRRPFLKEAPALPINEASAKIRTGDPVDDEEDYALPVWAGVLPLKLTPQAPVGDAKLAEGIELPDYLRNYKR